METKLDTSLMGHCKMYYWILSHQRCKRLGVLSDCGLISLKPGKLFRLCINVRFEATGIEENTVIQTLVIAPVRWQVRYFPTLRISA